MYVACDVALCVRRLEVRFDVVRPWLYDARAAQREAPLQIRGGGLKFKGDGGETVVVVEWEGQRREGSSTTVGAVPFRSTPAGIRSLAPCVIR